MKTKCPLKKKWLTVAELDEHKIKPHLDPIRNIVLQYDYDIENPIIESYCKNEKVTPWYHILGWDEECMNKFWGMCIKVYKANKKETHKWCKNTFLLWHTKKPTFDYIMSSPTSCKDVWEKEIAWKK